ncbi:MAG: hypothetical protein RLZZ501_137 [Pseudomonadota bacterium]|jgi:DNA-binding response OmpR family regulator
MDDVKHPRRTKRGRMFWVRAKVPADLKAYYAPKTEIIYSLKTSDPREALEKVRIASVQIDQEFNTARRKLNAELRVSLSDNEIERLAAIHLHTGRVRSRALISPFRLATKRNHNPLKPLNSF